MTREEWLRNAVEKLNSNLFNGDLDLLNKPYQISCGIVSSNVFSKDRCFRSSTYHPLPCLPSLK